mmetsp:Transcript_14098/g.25824  ORF Transcript_14098/g.25824 Transcript_14098/m.25824 type:complete len:105 (+) Transcript_14098:2-316(+)
MEFLVWRTKQSWTNATVSSSSDEREVELPTDEENPPAEIVASPIHNASNDDDNDDTANIELPKINPPDRTKQRKPSMLKTPSSKHSVPVSELVKRYTAEKTQQL